MTQGPRNAVPATKQELANNRQRVCRMRKKGKLYSRFIKYKRNNRKIFRLLHKVTTEILLKHMKDDLKAPYGNRAAPAFFSRPATNVYFAANKEERKDAMVVAAYGNGTGQSSIGLHPKTHKTHPFFGSMLDLVDAVTELVRKHPRYGPMMEGLAFDSVVGNLCHQCHHLWSNKKVFKDKRWHTDVTHKSRNQPCSNNSQKPGTPAVIVCFGDQKNLWFRRHKGKENHDNLIHFSQTSGSIFVIDPDDENPDEEGWQWKHMSDMLRGDDPHSMTISLVLRVTDMTVPVDKKQRTKTNSTQGVGDKERITFQEGEAIFTWDEHKEELEKLQQSAMLLLHRHKVN